jgi:hypothetical protein
MAEKEEFLLQYDTGSEVWVKHRATGHVYQFTISNGYAGLTGSYSIAPNLASHVSPTDLSARAKRFAYDFLRRSKKYGT